MRRQVCKRIGRRIQQLHLPDFSAYRTFLEAHPDEWSELDALCHISISRFFRDGAVFDCLATDVIPSLAELAISRGASTVRCWSAGCASGEEPYSLSILWKMELANRFPTLGLSVLATEADAQLLARARVAQYTRSSLRELPSDWVARAFDPVGVLYQLRPEYRAAVEFRRQDLRGEIPGGDFDLILCRNLVFTYFNEEDQRTAAQRLLSVLRSGGGFVIGRKEVPPREMAELSPWHQRLRIFRKV